MDTNVFDAVFWSFFITSSIGFVLALARFAYKSKCSKIDFCCIKIERNTEAEVKEDILEIERHPGDLRSLSANADEEKKSNNNV
jgi:hypothetical protein